MILRRRITSNYNNDYYYFFNNFTVFSILTNESNKHHPGEYYRGVIRADLRPHFCDRRTEVLRSRPRATFRHPVHFRLHGAHLGSIRRCVPAVDLSCACPHVCDAHNATVPTPHACCTPGAYASQRTGYNSSSEERRKWRN